MRKGHDLIGCGFAQRGHELHRHCWEGLETPCDGIAAICQEMEKKGRAGQGIGSESTRIAEALRRRVWHRRQSTGKAEKSTGKAQNSRQSTGMASIRCETAKPCKAQRRKSMDRIDRRRICYVKHRNGLEVRRRETEQLRDESPGFGMAKHRNDTQRNCIDRQSNGIA